MKLRWPWRRGQRRRPFISPDQVEDDDPIARMAIAAAWNTGKAIFATVDEDGNLEMHPISDEGSDPT